jgi:hypothetical protein
VVVHAFARHGRGGSWRVAIFDGVGDISAIYPDGPVRLQEQVAVEALPISWEWLELLSRLLKDLTDLEVVGDLQDGTGATIRCFDSAYWESDATPAVEVALAGAVRGRRARRRRLSSSGDCETQQVGLSGAVAGLVSPCRL